MLNLESPEMVHRPIAMKGTVTRSTRKLTMLDFSFEAHLPGPVFHFHAGRRDHGGEQKEYDDACGTEVQPEQHFGYIVEDCEQRGSISRVNEESCNDALLGRYAHHILLFISPDHFISPATSAKFCLEGSRVARTIRSMSDRREKDIDCHAG